MWETDEKRAGSGPPFHTLLEHKSPQHKKTANRLNFLNFLSKLLFWQLAYLGCETIPNSGAEVRTFCFGKT